MKTGSSRKMGLQEAQERRDAWLLLAPLAILMVGLLVYPVFSNIYYSFTRWPGFGAAEWTGLRNYRRLFADPIFRSAVRNTAVLLLYVPLGTIVPLMLAAVLRDGLPGWGFFRAALYIPNVLGFIIIGILMRIVLNDFGPLNEFLRAVGLDALAGRWLSSPTLAIHTVGLINAVWVPTGFGVIYFLAAMSSIDSGLFDAARIDGANWWQTFFSVTVPSIRFNVEFWIVLGLIRVFARLFGPVFTLTNGGPGYSTVTLEYGIYRAGFSDRQLGYAATWGVALMVICGFVAWGQTALIKRGESA